MTAYSPALRAGAIALCALVFVQACAATRPRPSAQTTTRPQLQACGGYVAPTINPGAPPPGVSYVRIKVSMTVDASGRVVPSSVSAGSPIGVSAAKVGDARARALADAALCSFVPAKRGGVAVASDYSKEFVYSVQ